MTDVAARVGVSYQTVSRVLNEPDLVRPATRERVLEAIADLGYTRNRAARALKTTRSSLIGVLTDGSSLFGPAETTTAIEDAARRAGYSMLLTAIGPDEAREGRVGAELLGSGIDGILVVAAYEAMVAAVETMARSTPVLSVSAGEFRVPGVETIGVDQRLGARLVTEHLAAGGRRRIVHLAGPSDWFDARARSRGFEAALTDLGLDGHVVQGADWTPHTGYTLGAELVRHPLPDAVFAANDLIALGLMRALHEHGVRIPEDVAVVGFDDTLGSAYMTPSLTTVAQPFAELGRTALEHLLARIEGRGPVDAPEPADAPGPVGTDASSPPDAPQTAPRDGAVRLLPPALVVRESSARP